MFKGIKDWFYNAIADGGGLLVAAVLVLGAVGGGTAVSVVPTLFDNNAPQSPSAEAPAPDSYVCPTTEWTKINGYDEQFGASYTVCSLNKVVIRHFDTVMPPFATNRTQAQDQGVYPFVDLDSVDEGIRIANSR